MSSGLEDELEQALRVSFDRMDTAVVHPLYLRSSYKARVRQETAQEERRRAMLRHQKENRSSAMNEHRIGIPKSVKELKKFEKQLKKQEQQQRMGINGNDYAGGGASSSKLIYKGVLMLSEWMVDVPPDLETNWIIKACPEGKRVLVVANRGWTRAYGRNGREVLKFPSRLPGGSYVGKPAGEGDGDANTIASLTIVDCILVRPQNTFYVLDVISWGCDMVNCEAEFRFFWLDSKMNEARIEEEDKGHRGEDIEEEVVKGDEKMEEDSGGGKKMAFRYRFKRAMTLNYRELVERRLPYPVYCGPNAPRLDGLLFYHREGHYSWRKPKSPLVVWLKPFMLKDILGLKVDDVYISEKPPVYNAVQMDIAEESSTDPAEETHKLADDGMS